MGILKMDGRVLGFNLEPETHNFIHFIHISFLFMMIGVSSQMFRLFKQWLQIR